MEAFSWSYWEKQCFLDQFHVGIIGSGIVGLSAAIQLKTLAPGLPVAVLERGPLPTGASTKNAGFACFGSMTELLDDLATTDEASVWALVERRYKGLLNLRKKLGDTTIGYEPIGGYELFRPEDEPTFGDCLDAMSSFNQTLRGITGHPSTFRTAGEAIPEMGFGKVNQLIMNTCEGQLHTGKMMRALIGMAREKGVEILNGIHISGISQEDRGVRVDCAPGGPLFFRHILLATNGLTRRLLPELDIHPARNQVLITEPLPYLPFRGSFHYDRGYYYFRDIDQRILLGGGRNLDPAGEATDTFGTTAAIRTALLQLLSEVILPHHKIAVESWWSGILGLGQEKKPIIKSISPGIAVAARLGGMGVAIGTLVGEDAAALLWERYNS
ncbi:MAG: NAD(P)/FAD-dependent oxidoreductase [Saprospiraceae bacterium]|jgi:glycine/D-amino acid oxidase-like deaminating enzyme